MFIGHFGAGFAAQAAAISMRRPTAPSLGTCMFAALLLDLLFAPLVLLGVEHLRIAPGITAVVPFDLDYYPWSHSLVMTGIYAVTMGRVDLARRREPGISVLLAVTVASHWVLDAVSHRPDVPVGLDGPFVGLGLWNSKVATIAVEGSLFALGTAWYARATRPIDRTGGALIALVTLLVLVYALSFVAPPPPDARSVAWTNLSAWLLVAWAYWIDRHRRSAAEAATARA